MTSLIEELAQSEFVRHEPCPACGSEDNLARYTDGHAYCFGCGHLEASPSVFLPLKQVVVNSKDHSHLLYDAQKNLGVKAWQWLGKYGIMKKETENWLWSESKEWLVFPILEEHGKILVWQARNFSTERPKPKTLTFGNVSDVLYLIGEGDTCVIVEDVISATKVGRQTTALPVWGSNIPLKTLMRLQKQFAHLVIWLDKDMAVKSLRSAERAKQLGFASVRSVITELDPKEYTDQQITQYLQ